MPQIPRSKAKKACSMAQKWCSMLKIAGSTPQIPYYMSQKVKSKAIFPFSMLKKMHSMRNNVMFMSNIVKFMGRFVKSMRHFMKPTKRLAISMQRFVKFIPAIVLFTTGFVLILRSFGMFIPVLSCSRQYLSNAMPKN